MPVADSDNKCSGTSPSELRRHILDLAVQYAKLAHPRVPFVPGEQEIPCSGKVLGAEEMRNLVDSALDFWLTAGRFNDAFEGRLRDFLGVRHVLTTNSGSSANLLAVAALTSPELGKRALKPGDEVITVAAGFPTTVNPLLLYGLVPVFVDVHIPTYNIEPSQVERAVTPRTRAIMLAHTLGNPFDLGEVMQVAAKHDLWVIEDCCDALGAKYDGRSVGTFGDIGTLSFYPAHQITTGEGGAVFTRHALLNKVLTSIRDWGRDCWCAAGRQNTCGKRFDWKLGDMPQGYDHKFIYSQLGYSLKMTDMQASVGLAQVDRLPEFVATRNRNFNHLQGRLSGLRDFLILAEATPDSEPSWFGFPILLRENWGARRTEVVRYLEQVKIATRPVFAGNLIRQPYFQGRRFRVLGDLKNTETIAERALWIGLHPALTEAHLDYGVERLEGLFLRSARTV